jgi:cell division protein FtsW
MMEHGPWFKGLSLAACALGLLCALQLLAVLRAPAAYFPSQVSVTLRPAESLLLGRQELAAPQADTRHMLLRRDASGHWWARNAGTGRPLVVQRGGIDHRTGSTVLQAGQQFQLGAAVFRVDAATGNELTFSSGADRWRFDGATLTRDGTAQPPCLDARVAARVAAGWNRWAPHGLTLARPLAFGGNLHCGNRLGIPGVAPGSAALARTSGGLLLVGAGGVESAPLVLSPAAGAEQIAQREEPLDGASALVIGRTRLPMVIDGATLRLHPAGHVTLIAEPQAELPAQVEWRWQQRNLWALPAWAGWVALIVLGASAVAAGWYWRVRSGARQRFATGAWRAAGLLVAALGLAALFLQRAGSPPGAAISMLLAWTALWYALLTPPRLNLATGAGVLLLAIGLLAQLELGLGAMESSWLRHFQKTASLLAVGLGIGAQLCMRRQAAPLPQARLEWLLVLLAAGALGALLLQVAYGDETGVFDMQPVEFAKVALTALTAHCIALGLGSNPGASGGLLRWLRLASPALLFAALLGVALVQVDDYSPLILLLVWGMAMAFAYALAAQRRLAAGALAGLACAAVLGVAGLRSADAAEVAQWSFYADRFLVWLDPATHPHTGQQLLLGARAIADGGWRGADGLFGLSTLGQAAGSVLRIPAVQDDFAPSFFLNRHGLAAALALWTLQALFLAGLLQAAARAWLAAAAARDFRHAWLARFRCFALCGGAAFVFGHFLLSWGTNLAILPIMGQPMSFLSAGGSHLLFFICPLLALGAASAKSIEESQSCRSMSNTKC